jgi:hypothetical protein
MKTPTTLLTVLCALLLLGGCVSKSKGILSVEVTDGCSIKISGMNVEQARKIINEWEFARDCELTVTKQKE